MLTKQSVRLKKRATAVLAIATSLIVSLVIATASQAANVVDVINVYIAPPFVQGTFLSNGIAVEDFNSYSVGACPTALTIGTVTGNCVVQAGGLYGGATASATDPTPTVGGTQSKYATTGSNANGMTFTLAKQSRYIGFWWSAGSPTNSVTFYQDNTEIVSLNSADLYSLFGTAPTLDTWSSLDSTLNELTAVNGSKHRKVRYYGNPKGYASTSPSAISTVTPGEPFVYVHLFAKGNLSFNKVKFSGTNFEFDNLVVAEAMQTPPSPNNYVSVATLQSTQQSVTYSPNGGDGTMSTQFGSTTANLSSNTFTRSGYTFGGWADSAANAAAGTVAYADGTSYPFTSDITLYAIWIADAVTVTETPPLASTGSNNAPLFGYAGALGLSLLVLGGVMVAARRMQKN